MYTLSKLKSKRTCYGLPFIFMPWIPWMFLILIRNWQNETNLIEMVHEICRRILGPNVADEVVASHFRSSLTLCSSSSSSTSPLSRLRSAKSSEMAVAEKIKKHMVREGREADAVAFTELHQVRKCSKEILSYSCTRTQFFTRYLLLNL